MDLHLNVVFELFDLLNQAHVARPLLIQIFYVLLRPVLHRHRVDVSPFRQFLICDVLLEGLDYLVGSGNILSFEVFDDMLHC